MAQSPAHRAGQIIGYALEESVKPLLAEVAREHSLYLDVAHPRPARMGRRLIRWEDDAGTPHNLDFVLEHGGSEDETGVPKAFIESAWRRYTKHSVNKAGEIANALVPLRNTFSQHRPFLGAVVAGEWTGGGLGNMSRQGIEVLHVPRDEIIAAFAQVDIDFDFGEGTSDEYLNAQVERWEALTPQQQDQVAKAMVAQGAEDYIRFRQSLEDHLTRRVERVVVLYLHGVSQSFSSTRDAIRALSNQTDGARGHLDLVRIEVSIRHSNGDLVEGQFRRAADAVAWLEGQV